ncbi:MAG: hypothetical protein K5744_06845 [Eubacterium sp.]|nr:hypothetical protein [Eubacterium sp.]
MSKIAVVIPLYKERLSRNEIISLEQCRKVLGGYDFFFLSPERLNVPFRKDEKIVYTSKENLSSRKKYSDYVLSLEFYSLFDEYEFMLIYQLDAFVFEDKLEYFCGLDYDYIGAEWLYGLECHTQDGQLWYFGNGGLSLRRVSAFKKWITEDKSVVDYGRMLLPEDLVISIYGREHLRIADRKIAMKFSYDLHPEECFHMNGDKLPFGCHAWYRFDNVFWKKIIDTYGYDVELVDVSDTETQLLCSGKERDEKLKKYYNKDKIDICLRQIITKYDGELYVFGAGQYGFSFINMIKNTSVLVKGVIDNDISKVGKCVEGIPILRLNDVFNNGENVVVLVTMGNPGSAMKSLDEIGLIKGVNYACSRDLQMCMCEVS